MLYKFNGVYYSDTNRSMTLCNLFEDKFVKLALSDLLKYSNFPTACPIMKVSLDRHFIVSIKQSMYIILQKNYYLKNYVVHEDSLPPFSISPETKAQIQLTREINGEHKMMAKVTIHIEMEADYHGSYGRLPEKQRYID